MLRLAVRALDAVDLRDAAELGDPVLRRAAAFHREADRSRFLAGRLAARNLVAACLDVPAADVTATAICPDPFCRYGNDGGHGRPRYFLAGEPAPLQASFSRSGNWLAAAILVSAGGELRVGIDLEDAAAEAFRGDGLDDVMASRAEKAALAVVEPADLPLERARLWVRKEALLKADGEGLRRDPRLADTQAGNGGLQAYAVAPEQLGLPPTHVLAYALASSRGALRVEFDSSAGVPG